ncbi:TM1266 family iron-only hydrogenase system putative regulator [Clostridium perfringens]|uniref:TM1266 family iron-only hydrogenase system putative regulator n=1 Tax=Clostridium perfringens TaxID=1502 RepID=UPI0018E4CA6A|nr:TM1266 family iron-only hydrogenase system putative regulator [Clostridium perfringens]ELC8351878.1 iron-only hydrogenase system regulator [Clostridium perfringens]MBI6003630.1 CopG family transcriptional regulator [Clostridium perfringens]MBI6060849.1 CopG family transcriptional regulator [Clostridium perfringens]MBI6066272.1 CopG family transcriptional regulator [Clostridium perfringens]MBI6087315.1 CopG family transcriptional regulator [Clostridium perfringens]
MSTRIAVVGIVIESLDNIKEVNSILSEYDKLIVGRMGLPYKKKNIRVISIVVDGTTDEISAITGKIGKLKGVSVKAAISKTSF